MSKMKINTKVLGIISFLLMITGIFLFIDTIPVDKMDPNRLKIEAAGAVRAREAGYGFKEIIRPVSYIFMVLGAPLAIILTIKEDLHNRRYKKMIKKEKINKKSSSEHFS